MKTLANNSKYAFYERNIFKTPIDHGHFYVMEDYSIGMHVQDFFEINIVTRGCGEHYINSNCVSSGPGDVYFIPPNIPHGYTGGKGFDVYHIIISNRFMREFATDLHELPYFFVLFNVEPHMRTTSNNQLYLKLTAEQYKNIKSLLDVMLIHQDFEDKVDSVIRTSLLMMCISLFCKAYKENCISTDDRSINHDNDFMKAIALIHKKFNEKITIDRLSQTAHLSRTAFIRKFIDIYKMPPSEYIIQERLRVSKDMLSATATPISDISDKVGFYDSAHFTKIFTSRVGISPGKYRENHKNKIAD